jgi:hypothetical protein
MPSDRINSSYANDGLAQLALVFDGLEEGVRLLKAHDAGSHRHALVVADHLIDVVLARHVRLVPAPHLPYAMRPGRCHHTIA